MLPEVLIRSLILLVPLAPFAAFAVLAATWFFGRTPGERVTARVALAGTGLSAAAAIALAAIALGGRALPITVPLRPWFGIDAYAFELSFFVDGLSLTMMVLVAVLTVITARFSVDYLHREPGFFRFFSLVCLFEAAMQVLVSSGGYDQLFVGWEVVGVCSALLVAFFHERDAPVRASLRVLFSYRACDVGILFAIVLCHHAFGGASYAQAFARAGHDGHGATTLIALALLLGAMGKSAQLPFGGWLPRAMEGPTPSSALFYGALSVHGGVYLLLRSAPLLAASPLASAAVIAVGASTAIYATTLVRVQTDAKGSLAHASMAQVGVMFVECGLGWDRVALFHLVGHACLRGYQLLRAPSALHDAREVHAALGEAPRAADVMLPLPLPIARLIHRLAVDRFHVEVLLDRLVIGPVLRLGRVFDALERRWEATVTGHAEAHDEANDAAGPTPSGSATSTPSPVSGAMARR